MLMTGNVGFGRAPFGLRSTLPPSRWYDSVEKEKPVTNVCCIAPVANSVVKSVWLMRMSFVVSRRLPRGPEGWYVPGAMPVQPSPVHGLMPVSIHHVPCGGSTTRYC